jgi:hypothetical protein
MEPIAPHDDGLHRQEYKVVIWMKMLITIILVVICSILNALPSVAKVALELVQELLKAAVAHEEEAENELEDAKAFSVRSAEMQATKARLEQAKKAKDRVCAASKKLVEAAVAHEEEAENELEEAKAIHAASVFGKDSHLPTGDFARLVDEIGEDFHGDELQKQLSLVDPTETGKIDKEAFIKWYCNLENEENDDESSEKSDVAEERNNADKAFVRVAGVDSDSILASDFKSS